MNQHSIKKIESFLHTPLANTYVATGKEDVERIGSLNFVPPDVTSIFGPCFQSSLVSNYLLILIPSGRNPIPKMLSTKKIR